MVEERDYLLRLSSIISDLSLLILPRENVHIFLIKNTVRCFVFVGKGSITHTVVEKQSSGSLAFIAKYHFENEDTRECKIMKILRPHYRTCSLSA